MAGPLTGMRVVELAGIGPGSFTCMMLADHGAEVVRVEKPGITDNVAADMRKDVMLRSRRIIAADLKSQSGKEIVRDLVRSADALVEGYRPGVAERLGFGPAEVLALNPALVYGRMTGWGQDGPYAAAAGHEINYLALSGALHAFGRAGEKPTPPINIVGNFGGGLMLAFGMVSALLHSRATGCGQIVDCAITDSVAVLLSMVRTLMAQGRWQDERGVNLLDSGAPFYDSYETSDGKYVSIGSIEPQFYALLREKAGLTGDSWDAQLDRTTWPSLREKLTEVFARRTRDEWCALMEGSDACFAPVLSMNEAPRHPHNVARGTFTEVDGVVQARAAPRYSVSHTGEPSLWNGCFETADVLRELGYDNVKLHAMGIE